MKQGFCVCHNNKRLLWAVAVGIYISRPSVVVIIKSHSCQRRCHYVSLPRRHCSQSRPLIASSWPMTPNVPSSWPLTLNTVSSPPWCVLTHRLYSEMPPSILSCFIMILCCFYNYLKAPKYALTWYHTSLPKCHQALSLGFQYELADKYLTFCSRNKNSKLCLIANIMLCTGHI